MPELIKALTDASPARRAAAAFVLGQVGATEQVAKVKPLLDDPHPVVRLRAAQGMLAARDKAAVPCLVSLLQMAPLTYLSQIEETLTRLADDKGPLDSAAAGQPVPAENKQGLAEMAWTPTRPRSIVYHD